MAAKVNLAKLSMDELKALKKDVEKAIDDFHNRKREEALKDVEAVAKKHGISVDELLGGKGKRKGRGKAKAKVPAKYCNPADKSQTWSGRGRQPVWFKEALKAGKSMKSLEI